MTDGPTEAPRVRAADQPRNPLIVLCAPEHADVLEAQFARYVHEYDVRTTASSAETSELLQGLAPEDRVALLVSETEVPDDHVMRAFHSWRSRRSHREADHRRPRQPVPRRGPTSCVRASRPASTTPSC